MLLGGAAVAASLFTLGPEGSPVGASDLELILGDLPDGSLGPAAQTVERFRWISIGQTTAGVSIDLPSPSSSTPLAITFSNRGDVPFNLLGVSVPPGTGRTVNWSGRRWKLSASPNSEELLPRVAFTATNMAVSPDDYDWIVLTATTATPPIKIDLVQPTGQFASVIFKQAGLAPARFVPPGDDVIDGQDEAVLLHATNSAVTVTYIGFGGWLVS